MLRIFQNIRPISAVYILVIALLVRMPYLFYGQNEEYHFNPSIMQGLFAAVNKNHLVSLLVGLIVVFIQAILFNRICIEHDVIYHHSYLPAYFYVIINSVYPENLTFNPLMIINFCVLFSLIFLFQLYQDTKSTKLLYYAALFLGTAALILPVFYLGMVFLIIGTMVFKNITLKDILGIVSGYAFAGIVAYGVYFILGSHYVFPTLKLKLNIKLISLPGDYIALSILVIITLAGLFKTFINFSKNNIKTRRITLLMVIYLMFSTTLLLMNIVDYRLFFPLLTVSMSIILAYFLIGPKHRRLKELLNYVLLFAVFYSLYGKFFTLF